MKKLSLFGISLLCWLCFTLAASGQGTAFTYQGRLNESGSPANGTFDLRFILFDATVGGNQQGPILTNTATAVSSGLFTVSLDFGTSFPGGPRWLEIAVRTNGTGSFTTLDQRQPLMASPYAVTAGNLTGPFVGSQMIGTVPSTGLAGSYSDAVTLSNNANSFTGNGAGLANVNAATLGGLAPSSFWNIGGNSGTSAGANFIGTTDDEPVEIRANGQTVMQYVYASNASSGYSPNLIGGNSANVVSAGVVGATIGGGGVAGFFGANGVTADFGTVVGGTSSSANGKFAIAGGNFTAANGQYSVALGGASFAEADYAVALGQSTASGTNAVALGNSKATNTWSTAGGVSVAGGEGATAMGASTSIGLGSTAMGASTASGDFSAAMGNSFATGPYSTALGACEADGAGSFAAGVSAFAAFDGSFVWADGQGDNFASTALNQFLVRAGGGVGINLNNPSAALHVASSNGAPQLQITQQNASDYPRLRMDSAGAGFWEINVSPGGTPTLGFWDNGGDRMNIDFNGNLTTAGTVNGTSDRHAKERFASISPAQVLEKVTELPISEWSFKNEPAIRHVGPMAQDFYAAFNLGVDDRHIATVDADGVALAAIQGLNQKVEQQAAELRAKDARLVTIEQELREMKDLVAQLSQHKHSP